MPHRVRDADPYLQGGAIVKSVVGDCTFVSMPDLPATGAVGGNSSARAGRR